MLPEDELIEPRGHLIVLLVGLIRCDGHGHLLEILHVAHQGRALGFGSGLLVFPQRLGQPLADAEPNHGVREDVLGENGVDGAHAVW